MLVLILLRKKPQASIINSTGKLLDKSISFSNSQAGCAKLVSLLDKFEADSSMLSLVWKQLVTIGLVFILI